MLSFTDITRRFRVHDYVVDTWMLEGVIPRCAWRNGHRYWSSDEINTLIAGCPITIIVEAESSIKKFSRRSTAPNILSSVVALAITLFSR